MSEPLLLEIGAGDTRRPGFTTLDLRDDADVVWDLEDTPLPFADGSVAEVYAFQVLEHVRGLLPLLNDLHRILVPGGLLVVEVPVVFDGESWWHQPFRDPTHVRFFTHETFDYLCNGGRQSAGGRAYGAVMWDRLAQSVSGFNMRVDLRRPR